MRNIYKSENVKTTDKTLEETKKNRNENLSKRWRIAHYYVFIQSRYW
jgi:hypothetical protein